MFALIANIFFVSWIIGGSQVKYFANKLLSQFCRSFDLLTGTCWVRVAHTAHLPKSAVLDFFHARKVSPMCYAQIGSISSLFGINAVQKSAGKLFLLYRHFFVLNLFIEKSIFLYYKLYDYVKVQHFT